MIRIFNQNGGCITYLPLVEEYAKSHNLTLDINFLNDLFGTDFPDVYKIFSSCADVFLMEKKGPEINHWRIVCTLLIQPKSSITTTEQKDIFKSSRSVLNSQMALNVKLADKVFEVVPEKAKIPVSDVLTRLYADTGENLSGPPIQQFAEKMAEGTQISPYMLIGYLHLYWNDVFKITPDYDKDTAYIQRQCMHHQKPSQEKKFMEEKMSHIPCYPQFEGVFDGEFHEVSKIYRKTVPSDGFFVLFKELDSDRDYVTNELLKEFRKISEVTKKNKRVLHPNITRLYLPCLLNIPDEKRDPTDQAVITGQLYRCVITGQSDGQAMAQLVDYPLHRIVKIDDLYPLPNHLLGVRQTGVYCIFNNYAVHETMGLRHWNELLNAIERIEQEQDSKIKVSVRFYEEAKSHEYSGRQKFPNSIFNVEIKVVINKREQILPGEWKVKL